METSLMQDKEQDYKDNKLEQNLADAEQSESPHPQAAVEGDTADTADTDTAPGQDAQPVEFVPDDAPLAGKRADEDDEELVGSSGFSLEKEHAQASTPNTEDPQPPASDDEDDEPEEDIEPLEP